MSDSLIIFTDGGSRGNPGKSACAWVIQDRHGKILYQSSRFLGIQTNNQAEYQGVIEALKYLFENKSQYRDISQFIFRLDSQLIAFQLSGKYRIKDQNLKILASQVKYLEQEILKLNPLINITYNYIPRSLNKTADALLNQKLDEN